jgi:hypothetical protein
MSNGHIDTSGMIHDFQCIADIASQLFKHPECYIKFLRVVSN